MVTKKESSFISRATLNTLLAFSFLSFVVMSSCKTEEPKTTDAKNKTEQVVKKKQNKAQDKLAGKTNANSKTAEYWSGLQKSLSLTSQQISALKKINNTKNSKIKALKKSDKLTKQERNKINQQANKAIAKLLGKEKVQAKKAYDKAWDSK